MNEVPLPQRAEPGVGRAAALTAAALVSFSLNSLLCRAALGAHLIDAVTFTSIRLISGAVVLTVLARRASGASKTSGTSPTSALPSLGDRATSALILFLYALPFSLAYLRISAGTGAFVIFGCVQITMIGSSLLAGRGLRLQEGLGLVLALTGLAWLTRPGTESPSVPGIALMAVAGFAWGLYSIRGRKAGPPLQANARNFAATVPMTLIASVAAMASMQITAKGALLALLSGAVTSGLGYVAWYAALPSLSVTRASILQLAVPPMASAMGVVILGEALSSRLLVAAPLILGGIALAVMAPKR
ncbi:MAG: DMT family transporter [Vicinamibacteria bacterium]